MRQIVDSTRINEWFISTRRDAQELLPHLVSKLITATVDPASLVSIRIPVGDDIRRPGFDGRVEVTAGHRYVPLGLSIWEMGTGDPEPKANADYTSRTKDPKGIEPAAAAFVFVTPHAWDGKDQWAESRRREGVWGDVRVLDNVDLAAWVELSPAVARWLASQMGIAVEALRDLELFWAEFEALYGREIPCDLVIGGRTDALARFQQWVDADSSEVVVEGESIEEASAFIAAAVCKLPEAKSESVGSRLLFVGSPEALEQVAAVPGTLFVVPLTANTRRRARGLRVRSLRLVVPQGRSSGNPERRESHIRLGSIGRSACEDAMRGMGLPAQQVHRIGSQCKGSLTALLWMVAQVLDTPLPWVSGEAALELAPLLLLGEWEPGNAPDRAIVERLCGRSCADIECVLARWSTPVGPLKQRGAIWDWLAWDFAWDCLAPAIDRNLIDRFRAVAMQVLGTPDPRFDLPTDQRWAAAAYGKVHPYSTALRSALVGSLVQLALHDDAIQGVSGQVVADAIVRDLLSGEPPQRKSACLSLSPWLADLAEAAPRPFCDAVEGLLKDDDAIAPMFDEGPIPFGSSPNVNLLWALERLAWSKEHFTRAVLLLGGLAAVDPGGRLSNRPLNSLTQILLPWHPQTTADIRQRLDAIELLHQRWPELAWRLLVSLLPRDCGVASPTAVPEWRTWKPDAKVTVPVSEYWDFVEQLVERMIRWAGTSGQSWQSLVDAYFHLRRPHPELAQQLLEAVQRLNPDEFADPDRSVLADAMRSLISRHREFPDVDWAISEAELPSLDAICERFQPQDLTNRHRWLFDSWPRIATDGKLSDEERTQQILELRTQAVRAIHASQGMDGALSFAERLENAHAVGVALSQIGLSTVEEAALLARTLSISPTRQGIPALLRVGMGYVAASHQRQGASWIDHATSISSLPWDANTYANLALSLPEEGATWDRVEAWGAQAAELYWSRAAIEILRNPDRDGERAMRRLLEAGRYYRAISLAGMALWSTKQKKSTKETLPVPTDLIVHALNEAPKHAPDEEWYPPGLSMVGHHVAELLDMLEKAGVGLAVLARIEWPWMAALRHQRRGIKALQEALSTEPSLFVDLLKLVYYAEAEEPREASEQEAAQAQHARRLLNEWKRVPGTLRLEPRKGDFEGDIAFDQGEVDQAKLFAWVQEARKLASECGRLDMCDLQIAYVLAYAPVSPDNTWPCEPVRNLIETMASERMDRGVETGIWNKRGVHARAKGGSQERQLAAKFAKFSEEVRSRWPRTADILKRLATTYEREARRQDERSAFEEFE